MYPSGVGTSYADPRRSNFTKTQSLAFNNGRGVMKDFSETTANVAPHPTDMLGTNLRRGRGLTFSRGIAQFDGTVVGSQASQQNSRPNSAYEGARDSSRVSSSRPQSALASGRGSNAQDSALVDDRSREPFVRPPSVRASHRSGGDLGFSGRANDVGSARYGGDDSARLSTQRSVFRPHSASGQRGPETVGKNDLPDWAREQAAAPSFAKTVDNQRGSRPGSARARSASAAGLPLSALPKWISLDKKVLNFEAFFKEAVEESRVEQYRVRRCVITYFLEDDSIKVSEPREENSGILQGNFLKRHRAMAPDGRYVNWRDIKVPGDLHLYRRTFRITKCDDFTRDFFERAGIAVGSEEPVPEDDVHRAQVVRSASATPLEDTYHGRQRNDMTAYYEALMGKSQDKKEEVTKYLSNDRKVLRFYCTWDERSGDGVVQKRQFRVHFFLADDSVEVLEVKEKNSGRDNFPALLKRMKLPKSNATGGGVTGGAPAGEHYTAKDFVLGGIVSVFGRQLLLNDCDDATARYYLDEFGVDVRAQRQQAARAGAARPKPAMLVPAHNGFGKEEDARQNCLSLHPKPPKGNVIRQLENKGKVLRFMGKLEHAAGFDVERVFTITYFLDADELSIFEPPVRNSGRTGGKFMEKCRVRKPNGAGYYSESDLHVGATVEAYARRFVLVDVDEYTLKHMESRPDLFPCADPAAVAAKLGDAERRALGDALRAVDRARAGCVPEDAFRAAVLRAAPALSQHEALTLARAARAAEGGVAYERVVSGAVAAAESQRGTQRSEASGAEDAALSRALRELRRQLYRRGPSGLRGLQRAMAHIARGAGALDRADWDTVLSLCGVALEPAHAHALFAGLDRGEGVVSCGELVAALRPALAPEMEDAVAQVLDTFEDPAFKTVRPRPSLRPKTPLHPPRPQPPPRPPPLRRPTRARRRRQGAVDAQTLLGRFLPGRHPRVVAGELSEREARFELQDALDGREAPPRPPPPAPPSY